MKVLNQKITDDYSIYNADCIDVAKTLPENSIGYTIFSPPFSDLYCYSNSERDMGNSKTNDEFLHHFTDYLIPELYRITKPGRNVSFHCMNLPTSKERDGYIGLKDFRGDLIKAFQKCGFIYHSEVVIWKDPLIAATRTKALGLMHKQLVKDSAMCRQGIPDYLITMRKKGNNDEYDYIGHENGLESYAGSDEPKETGIKYSHMVWRAYASPVWMDIRQTRVLNKGNSRNEDDEKHICPLQLDVIERCLTLWSKESDIVFSPFMGIGSEGYVSLQMSRKFIGAELKDTYFNESIKNLDNAIESKTLKNNGLF